MKQLDPSSTIDRIVAAAAAAQYDHVDNPAWSNVLLAIGIAGLAISGLPFFVDFSERLHRRIYWLGIGSGTLFMALALLPRGWRTSLGMCIAGAAVGVCFAFFHDDSLLKFGNRYISYTIRKHRHQEASDDPDAGHRAPRPPPDSYLGVVTARNHWWLVAILTCGLAAGLYMFGWTWEFSISALLAVAGAALFGFDDGARGFPIGRGQTVQFVIASVASLMAFAVPLLAYLVAYAVGKRWPMAHGRHAAKGDPTGPREPE